MSSKLDIWNLSLSHLGHSLIVTDTDEQSAEAAACRLFWEPALKATLRDFPHPFSTKISALTQIAENPNTEWARSYEYPEDCLMFRRILSGARVDDPNTRIPFRLAHGASGTEIYTDQPGATGEWTVYVADTWRFPSDFVMALSFRLAAYIAPKVTGGDPFKLGTRAMQFYQLEVGVAKAHGVNEEQAEAEPDAEMIRGRG